MKRIVSIPLLMLILFSGINFKIALHYCGGNISAMKVSLTGELATCGMERQADKSFQYTYSRHCCDDVTSSCSISSKYFPSYNFVKDPGQQVINILAIPADLSINQELIADAPGNTDRPPGSYCPYNVDLRMICVFRI
jgi:hypothetical protein